MFFSCDELKIELSGVFKIKRESDTVKTSDDREYDSISIRTKGSGTFICKDRSFSVSRGDVLYIPNTCDYTQKTDGETVYAIHFINKTPIVFEREEIMSVEDIDFFEETVKQMYDIWKEQQQGYLYKCTSLLYELIFRLNRQEHSIKTDGQYRDSRIINAIEYIHKNYRSEAIDIGSLALLCSVSEAYFRRSFKEVYGVSPKAYIINLKLDFASKLLKSRLYTVAEVSDKAGFSDTKYFSRLFKRHFGTTPGKYIR